MCLDPRLKHIFKDNIRVGYRRSRNLREMIFRPKLYKVNPSNSDRPIRSSTRGWKTCGKCLVCLNSENKTTFTCFATKEKYKINQVLNCKTRNIIYICECSKCGLQSVGKTGQNLQSRGGQHRRAVEKGFDKKKNVNVAKMYEHFESRGHSAKDMKFFAIEEVSGDEFVLGARETYWIDKLNTVMKGLNTYRT